MPKPIRPLSYAVIPLLVFLLSCTSAHSQQTKVYVTKTGAKYHLAHCRYLKYSKVEVELEDARKRDYTACLVCKPDAQTVGSQTRKAPADTLRTAQPERDQVPAQNAVASRCTATTQAGAQCKRMTKNASGKCWQHE